MKLLMTDWPLISMSLAGGLSIATSLQGIFHPRSRIFGPVRFRGTGNLPVSSSIALTFDDGPDPSITPRILDILASLDVRAAFFVIGLHARRYPDLLRRIHSDGHLLANHSFDHPHFGAFRGTRYWLDQFRRTDDAVADVISQRPAFFRPPMGIKTPVVFAAARRTGHTLVTWSRRSRDGVTTTPQRILDRLLPSTRPGDILVFHDGQDPHTPRDPSATLDSLGPLILGLRNRNLRFARLDHLLDLAPYATDPAPAHPATSFVHDAS